MPYTPSLQGHAAGRLRDHFSALIESPDTSSDDLQRLTGLLWNSTDILPRHLSDDLEMPEAWTHAQAARRMGQPRR